MAQIPSYIVNSYTGNSAPATLSPKLRFFLTYEEENRRWAILKDEKPIAWSQEAWQHSGDFDNVGIEFICSLI